jgi:hypothetical protein
MASVKHAWDHVGLGQQFPIKSAVVVANGDLVTLDSNGQVILADRDVPVSAIGFAHFVDNMSVGDRTGVAGLTVKTAIARQGIVNGLSSLTIGAPAYLSATGGGYTTATTTDTEHRQCVGFAIAADAVQVSVKPNDTKYQTSGATTVAYI